MLFNECLEGMMSAHDIKAIDIHKRTGLKKPYISKMLAGSLVPPSYNTVESIMDAIGLNLQERIALTDAYQVTRSSDESRKLWKAFSGLYSLRYPAVSRHEAALPGDIPNAAVLLEDRLMEAFLMLINSTEEKLYLFYTAASARSSEKMSSVFAALPKDKKFKWFMPFNDEPSACLEDFGYLVNCLPLLSINECTVTRYSTALKTLLNDSVFPFFIMNESSILLFDKELRTGQYFSDKKLVELYNAKYFARKRPGNDSFISSFEDPQAIINFFENEIASIADSDYDYYTFASAPCIVFDLPKQVISEHTADSLDGDLISTMYVSLLKHIISSANTFTDIFSCYGLIDYLDNEEYYELGKHLSKNLDRDLRRAVLGQFIGQAHDAQTFDSLGIKIPGFHVNAFIGANIISSGLLLLLYGFEEKTVFATVKEKSVVNMIIKYIAELKKFGFIASKEETISMVEKEIEKRITN